MALQLSTAVKNRLLEGLIRGGLTEGAFGLTASTVDTNGWIGIAGGTMQSPTDGVTHPAAAYLEISMANAPAPSSLWAAAANGVKALTGTFQAPETCVGTVDTATWFYFVRNGQWVMSGTVGLAGSGADLILDKVTNLSSSNKPRITNFDFSFSMGNGATRYTHNESSAVPFGVQNGAVRWNKALRNAMADLLFNPSAAPAVANAGVLQIYSAPWDMDDAPLTPDDALPVKVILEQEKTLSTSLFSAASNGHIWITGDSVSTDTFHVADGSSDMSFIRLVKGAHVIDFDIRSYYQEPWFSYAGDHWPESVVETVVNIEGVVTDNSFGLYGDSPTSFWFGFKF